MTLPSRHQLENAAHDNDLDRQFEAAEILETQREEAVKDHLADQLNEYEFVMRLLGDELFEWIYEGRTDVEREMREPNKSKLEYVGLLLNNRNFSELGQVIGEALRKRAEEICEKEWEEKVGL